jgi:putative phosphoesterase
MKFAVFSDSHDNWPNVEKAVKYLNTHKIPLIIHCGDVCAPSTLREMAKIFKGKELHLVYGNVDGDIEGFKSMANKNKKIKLHGKTGKLEIDSLKIVFCHFPFVAKKMAQSGKYDLVFHGHTHTPWQEQKGQTTIFNPGTLGGLFAKATFAIYDTATKKAQLIILEKI